MEILYYIFFLGIIYIVFSIIWFLLATLPKMVLSRTNTSNIENYIFKTLQYYFIGSLTSLSSLNFIMDTRNNIDKEFSSIFILTGGFVLFLYLSGKMERNKMLFQFKSFVTKNISDGVLKYEPHLIGFTMVLYALSIGFPFLVDNPINSWFLDNILEFYHTPIIGWIIRFIGFFFLITIIFRGINAIRKFIQNINALITGKPVKQKKSSNLFEQFKNMNESKSPFNSNQEKVDPEEDIYVDFEELEEDDEDSKE